MEPLEHGELQKLKEQEKKEEPLRRAKKSPWDNFPESLLHITHQRHYHQQLPQVLAFLLSLRLTSQVPKLPIDWQANLKGEKC